MTTRVQKWGNSLAIRIPNKVVEEMAIHQGTEVEITAEDDWIKIKPIKSKPTLDDLLSQCKPENRPEEIDFGRVGREML